MKNKEGRRWKASISKSFVIFIPQGYTNRGTARLGEEDRKAGILSAGGDTSRWPQVCLHSQTYLKGVSKCVYLPNRRLMKLSTTTDNTVMT